MNLEALQSVVSTYLANHSLLLVALVGLFCLSILQLWKKHYKRGVALLAFGLGWLFLYDNFANSVRLYISNLGSDSFAEAQAFKLGEAATYLTTLLPLLYKSDAIGFFLAFILTLACGFFVATLIRQVSDGKLILMLPVMLVVVPTFFALNGIWSKYTINSNYYENMVGNYSALGVPETVSKSDKRPTVITYIGESTSALQLGLYGYFRNNTPFLSNKLETSPNFLRFDNVFSTHVHTQQSLIEALSVPERYDAVISKTIENRKRVSIVKILEESGIQTALISNQARSGSWNLVDPIIFHNVSHAVRSIESTFASTMEWGIERPDEGVFLAENLADTLKNRDAKAIFLHSYAGHVYYDRHIPEEYKVPVDDLLEQLPPGKIFDTSIMGNFDRFIERLENSDMAYNYVDHNLERVFSVVDSSSEPLVIVYFSDHGDARYGGMAHDSAMYRHEMARIPFVIYFNDVAKEQFPEMFAKYESLSKTGSTASLAQYPDTLLNMLEVKLPESMSLGLIGTEELKANLPIIFRNLGDRTTYVDIFGKATDWVDDNAEDVSDYHTKLFRISQQHDDKNICAAARTRVSDILLGSLASNCVHLTNENLPGLEAFTNNQISKNYNSDSYVVSVESCLSDEVNLDLEELGDNVIIDVLPYYESTAEFMDCLSKRSQTNNTMFFQVDNQNLDMLKDAMSKLDIDKGKVNASIDYAKLDENISALEDAGVSIFLKNVPVDEVETVLENKKGIQSVSICDHCE